MLRDLAEAAARAATGGNIQPWHIDIVHGDAHWRELKAIMAGKLARGETETPGYDIYPREMEDRYKRRTFAIGEAMYAHLGIPRDDKVSAARMVCAQFRILRRSRGVFLHRRPADGAAAMVGSGNVSAER